MANEARAAQEQQFWDRYSKIAAKQDIKPDFVRWHVLRG